MEILKRFQADRHVRLLQSPAPRAEAERTAAAAHLLALGSAGARALLGALTNAPASEASLGVLERLLREDTLALFVDALRSPSATTADAATRVLARARAYDPTQLLALYRDERVSRARLEGILEHQLARIQPTTLLRILPELGKEARNSAFRLLDKRADLSVLNDAVELCTHAEWWIRMHMARLLAKLPGTATNTALAKLVRDDNGAVRLEAVRAVAQLKASEAIPALCSRLSDPDLKVQSAAIEALVGLADVSAVPHLLDALKNESEYVRRGAVEVLNEVITQDAIKDLVAALRDADWWVRARSADALGTLGGPRVVEAVLALTRDPDDFARRYAIEILNTVPDPRAVPALIEALEDEDWWVRERAVDALAKTGDASAVEPLLRMMGRDARSLPLCVRALGTIATPGVVEPLCRLAESSDPDVRREAITALSALSLSELPESARREIVSVLDKAGVRVKEPRRGRPLDLRPGRIASPGSSAPGFTPAPGSTPSAAEQPVSPSGPAAGSHAPASSSSGALPGTPPAPTAVPAFQKLAPGTELAGRFRVLHRVGGGGFGTVYLVEDVLVKEELVLKILSPQLSLDPQMIRRFIQELKLTRRIAHPNVIRIYDLLDLDGAHAISMEHFAARDLGERLRLEGPWPAARLLPVVEQVLEGLIAAHGAGILHRDLKPANVLVNDEGHAKLVDFGLAAVSQTSAQSRLTQSGLLVGTPEYISPEQITGTTLDARSDLYSLGVVMYEMLTGRQPFSGPNAVNVLFQHLEATVPDVATVAAGVTAAVNDLVMSAMARDAARRPATASEMLARVRAAR